MLANGRRKIEEMSNSKMRQLEKQSIDWSDLILDVVECIIGHLLWPDRIRIRAVCRAWSISTDHIPIIDRLPWAMTKFRWGQLSYNGPIFCQCRLLDPFRLEYVKKRWEWCPDYMDKRPLASTYGWVLLDVVEQHKMLFILFSPFTKEVIKLPKLDGRFAFHTGTFYLNATSPKCVVFLLSADKSNHMFRVKLCSPGDSSWKNFEFKIDFDYSFNFCPVDVVYANGVFYCVFSRGELAAFEVELEEWTILADLELQETLSSSTSKLVISDTDLLLLDSGSDSTEPWKLYRFDFSEMLWVYENNLNNRVLFIGYTSYSAPAVGVTSPLANIIFSSNWPNRAVRPVTCYGSTSPSARDSLLYRKYYEAAKRATGWIELPACGIWSANDLINFSSK